MFKVAVTGASGFIGHHVLHALSSYEVVVTAITRKDTGDSKLPSFNNAKWLCLDINDPPEDVFKTIGEPDVLIHLAWQGLPNYHSRHHFESELGIQYSFLKNLISHGLKSVFITGTCFEYGMQSGELSEQIEVRPDNSYGFAKNTLRKQLEFFQKEHAFNLTWARLFYLYGEGQAASSLLPLLKNAVAKGVPLFNMSGGEQLRDYLPVEKVANAIVQLALKEENIGLINICSGKPQSVRNLVENWVTENQWDIKLNLGHYDYPDYEPMAFWGNDEKLKSKNIII